MLHRAAQEGTPTKNSLWAAKFLNLGMTILVKIASVITSKCIARFLECIVVWCCVSMRRATISVNVGHSKGVSLEFVTNALEEFAHPALAQSWDNVGLLVKPVESQIITTILLTNDLTEDVMDEALLSSTNLIITYHPLIFTPLKRITNVKWKERIISKCLANNIAVYSPHTSWDTAEGGVNDWLASAFSCFELKPIIGRKEHNNANANFTLTIESVKDKFFDELKSELHISSTFKLLFVDSVLNSSNTRLTIRCDSKTLRQIVPRIEKDSNVTRYFINPEYSVSEITSGTGRICTLDTPISIRDVISTLKKHVGIPLVQLALARNATLDSFVRTIAFAAGSGGSLLKNIIPCDMKITGESSHHDILDSVHDGSSVILTHHSNSERGFLKKFKEILTSMLNDPSVQIIISKKDSDPLTIL